MDFFQLRDREISDRAFESFLAALGAAAPEVLARTFVNDRLALAAVFPVAGVHLPEAGLPVAAVRSRFPRRRLLIGRSVHGMDAALAAERDGADYVILGPVAPTGGKRPLPPDTFPEVCRTLRIPVWAVGGLTSANLDCLLGTGVSGLAAIRSFGEPRGAASPISALTRVPPQAVSSLWTKSRGVAEPGSACRPGPPTGNHSRSGGTARLAPRFGATGDASHLKRAASRVRGGGLALPVPPPAGLFSKLTLTALMTTRVAWLAALLGLAIPSTLPAQSESEAQLERAAERRFLSAEQFYAGGRHAQALRDFEAILDAMPESRLADDAALRIARHRFELEGNPVAAEEMVSRLLREYPAGDTIPGAHLLLGQIAATSVPPRSQDGLAEFERVLTAAGPAGSPWSFAALTGIAAISFDLMDDGAAAGALLSALHETRPASESEADRFRARFLLARSLARLGDTDAALSEIARLRTDLLRVVRDGSSGAGGGSEEIDFSPGRLAERAGDLATLMSRYRSPGGPAWRFVGAVQPPQRLDRPLRVRVAGGRIHVLDRDTDELQTFSVGGDFEGAIGVDSPRDVVLADRAGGQSGAPAVPVVATEEALIVDGNVLALWTAGADRERLRRIRALTVTPEGYWVWDDREKTVFRFARSGLFLGRVPHPRLDEVHRIERHPSGHLVVLEERQGVLAFDAEGRRIFHLTRESGAPEPVDLAFDALGNLFVLDRDGPSLAIFDRQFAPLATLPAGEWSAGALRRPISLDVGADGRLYVLDESTRSVGVFR